MGCDNTEENFLVNDNNNKDEKKKNKRVMTPAIKGMSVKQERACLSEIRSNAGKITENYILQNGWNAGDFSLKYIMGHQTKRKTKTSIEKKVIN